MLEILIKRPYVVAFLITFLIIGIKTRGTWRTLIFLFTGYFIAWISEASSIRTGFPYGWYFYIYENLEGAWLNWGVPIWDSLSYTFLCFAGLSLAEFVWPDHPPSNSLPSREGELKSKKLLLPLFAACFVVILDIVIDPLAHQGDQWFLGKIYYYPNPGWYFNVPVSNFLGWFLVSFLIIRVNLLFDSWIARKWNQSSSFRHVLSRNPNLSKMDPDLQSVGMTVSFWTLSGPLLYFGIFLFNWIITLWIHQWALALCDLLWISIPLFFFIKSLLKYKKSP